MAGAGNDKQFQILCKCLKLNDVGNNPKFSTNRQRVTHRKELLQIIIHRFKSKNTSEWLEILEDSGIPYGPINNIQQVFSDKQVIHNGMIQEMRHPTAGLIRVSGPAVKFSESPTIRALPPPTLGQHTDSVLKNILKLSDEDIARLKRNVIVK